MKQDRRRTDLLDYSSRTNDQKHRASNGLGDERGQWFVPLGPYPHIGFAAGAEAERT